MVLFSINNLCVFGLAPICLYLVKNYLRLLYYMIKIPTMKNYPCYPLVGHLTQIGEISRASTYFKICKQIESFCAMWYGPIPLLFVKDAEIAQTILTNPDAVTQGSFYRFATYPIFKDSVILAQAERWRKVRKLFNHAFTKQILDSFIPIFNSVSAILEQQFEKELGNEQPFDAYRYIGRGTLDAVCGTAMGVNFSLQKSSYVYYDIVHRIQQILFKRLCSPWLYPSFIFNRTSLKKELDENIKIIFDLTHQVFEEKWKELNQNGKNILRNMTNENVRQQMEKNPLKLPFLEFLIELVKLNPEIMSKEKLKDEINFIILAGYETTALTLSNIILSLASLKHIQDRAYEEIYNVFGDSDRSVEVNDLPNLKYLEMIIKESMRLFPPIVQIVRKLEMDFSVDGYKIPGGVDVIISIMAMHRDPRYWENPLEFNPERFSPEAMQSRHPFAYIPFGAGIRNCIGAKYAIMFVKIVLVYILRKYEFNTHLKLSELEFTTNLTMELIGGHLVTINGRHRHKT